MKRRRNFWLEALFVGLALAVGVGFSLKPWRAFAEQKQVRDRQVEDLNKAESRIEALSKQRARAESPLGREELARKEGYVRPNESSLDPE